MNKSVILYSTGCPKCGVLKKKLDQCGVEYELESDVEKMISLNIKNAPALGVDGEILDFNRAVEWVRSKMS